MENLDKHYKPQNKSDRVALAFTKFLRFIADTFFKKKYGHRAVVLETVAAVPGMVAGMLMHLKSLRKMEDDKGWIKVLLEEAENERMHLMTFIEVAKPTLYLLQLAHALRHKKDNTVRYSHLHLVRVLQQMLLNNSRIFFLSSLKCFH